MGTENDNRMVWDARPGHYEVWYTTLSHLPTRTGFWIRYTVHAPIAGRGEPFAKLWFARFDPDRPDDTFGIHKRYALSSFKAEAEPFSITIGDSVQRHDGNRGSLQGAGHEVRWELDWRPSDKLHLHLPNLLYKGSFGDTKVLSPNLSVPTTGTITVDGKSYVFEGEPAGQTHLWGRKHAYQWAWSHCNLFDGAPGAAFESISARLKRGAVILPRMTVFTLYLDGETIEFREAWKIPLTRSDFQTGRYHLVGVSADTRVEAEFTCRPEEMILTEYVDPDGDPAFCHNTCIGSATIQVKRRSPFVGRWRDAEKLTATRTAHWEWGARAGDAATVKKHHVRIEG